MFQTVLALQSSSVSNPNFDACYMPIGEDWAVTACSRISLLHVDWVILVGSFDDLENSWGINHECIPSSKLTWQMENGPIEDLFPIEDG